jgi:hypothetical protein
MTRITATLVISLLGIYVASVPAVAQERQREIQTAIVAVDNEIAAAEKDTAKYSGGLVKALIESRLQTLKQTRAMLDQCAKSSTFGVNLRYTVDGRTFAPPADAAVQASAVEAEIAKLETTIAKQQAEADRYSGGLVQALSLSTVATSRQTLAMLRQKYLALKFGLPQFIGFSTTTPETAGRSSSPGATPTPTSPRPQDLFEIVNVDSRVTESNTSWSRFAWRLTIRNKDNQPHRFNAKIEFQDRDGFVVDDDDEYGLVVPANSEQVFTGYDLIEANVVAKVARTNAKVQLSN